MDKTTELGPLTAFIWDSGRQWLVTRDVTGTSQGSGFLPRCNAREWADRTLRNSHQFIGE